MYFHTLSHFSKIDFWLMIKFINKQFQEIVVLRIITAAPMCSRHFTDTQKYLFFICEMTTRLTRKQKKSDVLFTIFSFHSRSTDSRRHSTTHQTLRNASMITDNKFRVCTRERGDDLDFFLLFYQQNHCFALSRDLNSTIRRSLQFTSLLSCQIRQTTTEILTESADDHVPSCNFRMFYTFSFFRLYK